MATPRCAGSRQEAVNPPSYDFPNWGRTPCHVCGKPVFVTRAGCLPLHLAEKEN